MRRREARRASPHIHLFSKITIFVAEIAVVVSASCLNVIETYCDRNIAC